jgi:hypothetical protein
MNANREMAHMPTDVPPALLKEAMKEAMSEWLDRMWQRGTSSLGKWVVCGVLAAALIGLVKLAIISQGWKMP